MMAMAFDIIIRNGLIVDGSGKASFAGDVGIVGERIEKVGRLPLEVAAQTVLDAAGCIVCPGFIDVHSHTDLGLFVDPTAQSKIMQGITTEISGNCGFSPAPALTPETQATIDDWRRTHGLDVRFKTMGELFGLLEQQGLGLNYASLVGHGQVRASVMGYENRQPTSEELKAMQRLIEQSLDDGCLGLSTGLIYPPGCYAFTDELVELSRSLRTRGAIYASHMRNEGDQLIEATQEAIEIARQTATSVQLSHHKATGKKNWGKVKTTLALIDGEGRGGLNITCDQYPYTAASTSLKTLIKPWAHEGGKEELLKRLKDPTCLRRMRDEVSRRFPTDCDWERIMVSEVFRDELKQFEGKRMTEVAGQMGCSPFEALVRVLLEDEARTSMVIFLMCEEDVEEVMRFPHTMIGTDSSAKQTDGRLSSGKPHPRGFGTFPKVLGHYVRERKILPLEEAVQKMTSLPAEKFGLKGRGLVKEGYFADVVVFDANTITDTATYDEPHQLPKGIHYVLVNGKVVVENGQHTGKLPGRVLRGNRI